MTTIHQRLVEHFNFAGCYSSVRRLVNTFKKRHPKATCILDFALAEAAQVDLGKGPDITDTFSGHKTATWIFVMTLCFRRHMSAEIVTNQKVDTWLGCRRRAFEWFSGVPAKLMIDPAEAVPSVRSAGPACGIRRTSALTKSWPRVRVYDLSLSAGRAAKKA